MKKKNIEMKAKQKQQAVYVRKNETMNEQEIEEKKAQEQNLKEVTKVKTVYETFKDVSSIFSSKFLGFSKANDDEEEEKEEKKESSPFTQQVDVSAQKRSY